MTVALITGATSGLGYEFTRIYASHGFNLVIVARHEGRLRSLAQLVEKRYHVHVYPLPQDLSAPSAPRKVYHETVARHLHVDVLVNNAGFGDFGNFWEGDPARQSALLNVDVGAVVGLTRLFLPAMVDRHRGRILNVASVAAVAAGPRMALYYAAKAFVRSFSEALSEETRGTGVAVTALLPGPVATGFEKASGMEGRSTMFHRLRPASAEKVAQAAYRASQRGRALISYGAQTRMMILLERLVPRSISRRFAGWING